MGRMTAGNNRYYEEYKGVCPYCKQSLDAYMMPTSERVMGMRFSFGGFHYLSHRVEQCIFSISVQIKSTQEITTALYKIPLISCPIVQMKELDESLRHQSNLDRKPTYYIRGRYDGKPFSIEVTNTAFSIVHDIEFGVEHPEYFDSREIIKAITESVLAVEGSVKMNLNCR